MKRNKAVMVAALVAVTGIVFYPFLENYRDAHARLYLPGSYEMFFYRGVRMVWRPSYSELKAFERIPNNELPDKRMIGPNIDGYRAFNNIITGYITKHVDEPTGDNDLNTSIESKTGYFIVEVDTKKVYEGLGKQEWIQKLKTYGIDEVPVLLKLSWRDPNSKRIHLRNDYPKKYAH